MTATRRDVKDALFDFVAAVSGFDESKIVWQAQDVTRPLAPAITMHLLSFIRSGTREECVIDTALDTEDFPVVGQFEGTLSLSFYGVDADIYSSNFQTKMFNHEFPSP